MIISEKQIMQLIDLTRQYMSVLLCAKENKAAKETYNASEYLLNSIANQQSEKLIEVKDE